MGRIPHQRKARRIQTILGQLLLSELNDPRLGFVTVNRVELAVDSVEATVYVSILGTDSQRRTCLRALVDSRGYLQKRLGAALQARRTPILRFEFDESVDRSLRLEEIFKGLERERNDRTPEGEESDEDETESADGD